MTLTAHCRHTDIDHIRTEEQHYVQLYQKQRNLSEEKRDFGKYGWDISDISTSMAEHQGEPRHFTRTVASFRIPDRSWF